MSGSAGRVSRIIKNLRVPANLAVSATSPIFADSFVNQSVEFVAREGNVRAGGFTGVVGFGELGASAWRRGDEVSRSRGHQLGDFAAGEKDGPAGQLRGENDLGKMLDGFHAEEGCQKIRPAGDRAVISQEQSVVVRDEGFDRGAEFGRSGSGIAHQRN